ncbi:MAG TPA: response regulator [Candidatus Sulfotelmatobacter sp.]|nr:response regulator [Candidatus Sulfotelmatobacter sp.]
MDKQKVAILVAEDEANDQTFIRMAFEEAGVTGPVHIVNNGVEAIAYIMGEGKYADRGQYPYPTFILTDLKMPHADGFAVLKHLQSNPQWTIIPTVVLSASNDSDDIKKAYQLGARAFHRKPNTYSGLCAQLKLLYDYWLTCEVPEVDVTGRQLPTESKGKLGERFPQPSPGGQQSRAES